MFKTEGELFERARRWLKQLAILSTIGMGAVSLATLSVDPRITERWGVTMTSIDWPVFIKLAPLPIVAGILCFLLWRGADLRRHSAPYLSAVGLFLVGYIGLAISVWPYIVPFTMTPAEAAAADNALALLLWGALPMLPIILAYTAYVYWLFRAKVTDEASYH